jgi:molecular chaperone DnaJ
MLQHIIKNVRFGLFMHQKQKNHYEALGLSSKANSTEIKKKYYELAKYYHPDVNKSSDAEKTFH